MSIKINPIFPKHQPSTNYKPAITPKVADKTKQTNQAINRLAVRFGGDDEPVKKVKPAKPKTYTPKAVIIPLTDGKKSTTHDALSYRLVKATLEQNGIKPSKIEMEEVMALPQNQKIDLHGWLDKNWKFHDLPGNMPSPGTFKDINGKEAFGYKMTLSPKWQAGIVDDYKQVRGELAKPENVGKKAVLDMNMEERMQETIKIAYEKGYITDEVYKQLGSITLQEGVTAFGLGALIGAAATTEIGAAALGPVGGVLSIAYMSKKLAEFDPVTEGAAKATKRSDLDKPAQELGKWFGTLAKDGALAAIGGAGAGARALGANAIKKMPSFKDAIKNRNQVKEAVKSQQEQVTPKEIEPKSTVKAANKTSTVKDLSVKFTKVEELNPTQGMTLSKKAFAKLKADIKENGILDPIKYVSYNGRKFVVDGHHRLIAAKMLGIKNVPTEEVKLPYLGYKNIDDLFSW